ncbi:MAG TPA: PAS domain S-box protein, partial [Leptospiraceae bacterium]|nr:PAS domain S-box protein [Leptospiraceae bacterium]
MKDFPEGRTLERTLLQNLGEGVYGVDQDGLCTFVNEAALAMLGFSEAEVLKKDQHTLFHWRKEDGSPYPPEECPVSKTIRDLQTRHVEDSFVCKDGRMLPVELTIAPVSDEAGRPGAVVAFQDLTELRKARAEAKEAVEMRQVLLDQSLAGIALLKDRRILWANRRMETMFGYNTGGLHGLETSALYAANADFQTLGEQAYPTMQAGGTYSDELLMKRKDGATFWCQLSGQLVNPREPARGSIWTISDVDENHRRAQELVESEERYRQAFEVNSAIKLIIDEETGAIVDANGAACHFYGYSREQLLRMNIRDINCMSPDEITRELTAAGKQQRLVFEFKHMLSSGEIRDVEVYSGPIRVDGRPRLHSIIHDITERKKAQSDLELAARVITGAAEGVVVTDQHAKILAVNPAFTEITGFAQSEAIGQTPRILASGRQSQDFYQAMWEDLIAKGNWAGEIWNRKKDGTVYPEWLSISRTGSGADLRYIAIFSDITRRKADEERIRRLAHYDPLTGLPNRALLFDRAMQALSLCRRGDMPLALMFLDVDHFKRINDTLGHKIGDEILVALSQRLTGILRVEDTVCRLGGDEFVILLPEIGAEGAAHVATKLVESIQTPLNVSGGIAVTLSVGITMFPEDGDDFEILCKNADTAMYRAKAEGRNGFRFYTAEMQKKAARHWELEHALRSALANGELAVHYQPQLSLDSSTVTGVEALLRWTHPQLGAVSPVEFIPIAEEIGLITTIGHWVLRCAVKQAVSWIQSGRESLVMSV